MRRHQLFRKEGFLLFLSICSVLILICACATTDDERREEDKRNSLGEVQGRGADDQQHDRDIDRTSEDQRRNREEADRRQREQDERHRQMVADREAERLRREQEQARPPQWSCSVPANRGRVWVHPFKSLRGGVQADVLRLDNMVQAELNRHEEFMAFVKQDIITPVSQEERNLFATTRDAKLAQTKIACSRGIGQIIRGQIERAGSRYEIVLQLKPLAEGSAVLNSAIGHTSGTDRIALLKTLGALSRKLFHLRPVRPRVLLRIIEEESPGQVARTERAHAAVMEALRSKGYVVAGDPALTGMVREGFYQLMDEGSIPRPLMDPSIHRRVDLVIVGRVTVTEVKDLASRGGNPFGGNNLKVASGRARLRGFFLGTKDQVIAVEQPRLAGRGFSEARAKGDLFKVAADKITAELISKMEFLNEQ